MYRKHRSAELFLTLLLLLLTPLLAVSVEQIEATSSYSVSGIMNAPIRLAADLMEICT